MDFKVGGLGDVVSGLGKALQMKGHLVEIILPKYDCMQYDRICDLKVYYFLIVHFTPWEKSVARSLMCNFISWILFQVLDVALQSYFDGQLFKNQIWVGTVEGL